MTKAITAAVRKMSGVSTKVPKYVEHRGKAWRVFKTSCNPQFTYAEILREYRRAFSYMDADLQENEYFLQKPIEERQIRLAQIERNKTVVFQESGVKNLSTIMGWYWPVIDWSMKYDEGIYDFRLYRQNRRLSIYFIMSTDSAIISLPGAKSFFDEVADYGYNPKEGVFIPLTQTHGFAWEIGHFGSGRWYLRLKQFWTFNRLNAIKASVLFREAAEVNWCSLDLYGNNTKRLHEIWRWANKTR